VILSLIFWPAARLSGVTDQNLLFRRAERLETDSLRSRECRVPLGAGHVYLPISVTHSLPNL